MNKPFFSIIVCSYNNNETIKRCLLSILNQSFRSYEIVIIDNLSSDGTLETIHGLKNDCIHLISEKDNGIYNAINKGISIAKGEVISILHADNLFANTQVLQKTYDKFHERNSAFVYSDVIIINRKNKITRTYKSGNYKKNLLAFGWAPPHPGIFISKKLHEEIGLYREDLKISSDYHFLIRLFRNFGDKSIYFKEITVIMQDGGISNSGFKNHIYKWLEDYEILKLNYTFPFFILVLKITRKLKQLKIFKHTLE